MSNEHDPHHHDPFPAEPAPPPEPAYASELPPSTNAPPPGAADSPNREAPPRTPPRRSAPAVSDDGILRPIADSEIFSRDPAVQATVSAHIDEYFNQPLDLFPFWEKGKKPDRFHVLFARQIEERFPIDQDMRSRIHEYGRAVFKALLVHVSVKRLMQGLTLFGLTMTALWGPNFISPYVTTEAMAVGLTIACMLVIGGLWWAITAILFTQYRFQLENDSYELSREMVQRTRELQNLFTTSRAMPDQLETEYQNDGKAWGQRSTFLVRLTMWLAARMEYLEKYIQMELWRVRRERYWTRWSQRLATPLVFGIWLWWVWTFVGIPQNPTNQILVGASVVAGIVISILGHMFWRTPMDAIQSKLGTDSWVRYSSLDVDNAVADQVRRDKERLVEYRALTRGR